MNQATEVLDRKTAQKSMKNSIREGIGYSIMAGSGDTYLPAAILQLGASNFQVGILAALPHIVGGMTQFFSVIALKIAKSRKLLVSISALFQALCWIPIILALLWPSEHSVLIIIASFTLGAAAVWLANPAWSSWIADIVPENERADFFAKRNRLMQLVLFAITLATGFLLNQLQNFFSATLAFALIFCIPFISRVTTVFFHWKTADVKYEIQLVREIRLKHLFLLPSYKRELWFLVFIALVNFGVQFASPFFTPFMINHLNFSLELVGLMIASSVLAKIISYPYWSKAIDRFGNRVVLIATSFGMVAIPFMWLISTETTWLIWAQVFSGFVWAGLDLASFNFALSMVERELRPSFISKYNTFGSIFYALGAISGGLFLQYGAHLNFFGLSDIPLLFLISGTMRLLTVLVFTPKLSSSKEIENKSDERAMILKLVAVYPTQGAIQQVLNGWNFTRKVVKSKGIAGKHYLVRAITNTTIVLKEKSKIIAEKLSKQREEKR
ncbi:MAG: MFS transporter [Candidatus Anstonellaceae archaeon]